MRTVKQPLRKALTASPRRKTLYGLALSLFSFPALACTDLRVVDGDTIFICGEYVRLTGYDTPEIRGAQCKAELVRGMRARTYLAVALGTREWYLHRRWGEGGTDRYGRRLARLEVDGQDISDIMQSEGLARSLDWDAGERRRPWCAPGEAGK